MPTDISASGLDQNALAVEGHDGLGVRQTTPERRAYNLMWVRIPEWERRPMPPITEDLVKFTVRREPCSDFVVAATRKGCASNMKVPPASTTSSTGSRSEAAI